MMKAANTAGTLMKRRNWSIESIAVSPKTKTYTPAALFHPVRDVLIGRQKLIGNGGSTHREQRQDRNHSQKSHGRKIDPDCGQKRQSMAPFQDDPGQDHGCPHRIPRVFQ
jgi:hypothetical protein